MAPDVRRYRKRLAALGGLGSLVFGSFGCGVPHAAPIAAVQIPAVQIPTAQAPRSMGIVVATPGPPDIARRLALTRDPRTERALSLWHREHRYAQAATLLKAIRADRRKRFGGDDGQILRLLLQLYRSAGDGRHELEACREIVGPHPGWASTGTSDPTFLKRYAALAERYGAPSEAAGAYRRVLATYTDADPTVLPPLDARIRSFRTLKARALAARVNGMTPEGLDQLQKAVDADPSDPVVRFHLAWALQETRQLRRAKTEFARLTAMPKDKTLDGMVSGHVKYLDSFTPKDLARWDKGPLQKPFPPSG